MLFLCLGVTLLTIFSCLNHREHRGILDCPDPNSCVQNHIVTITLHTRTRMFRFLSERYVRLSFFMFSSVLLLKNVSRASLNSSRYFSVNFEIVFKFEHKCVDDISEWHIFCEAFDGKFVVIILLFHINLLFKKLRIRNKFLTVVFFVYWLCR